MAVNEGADKAMQAPAFDLGAEDGDAVGQAAASASDPVAAASVADSLSSLGSCLSSESSKEIEPDRWDEPAKVLPVPPAQHLRHLQHARIIYIQWQDVMRLDCKKRATVVVLRVLVQCSQWPPNRLQKDALELFAQRQAGFPGQLNNAGQALRSPGMPWHRAGKVDLTTNPELGESVDIDGLCFTLEHNPERQIDPPDVPLIAFSIVARSCCLMDYAIFVSSRHD
jgi:hypothetical protein